MFISVVCRRHSGQDQEKVHEAYGWCCNASNRYASRADVCQNFLSRRPVCTSDDFIASGAGTVQNVHVCIQYHACVRGVKQRNSATCYPNVNSSNDLEIYILQKNPHFRNLLFLGRHLWGKTHTRFSPVHLYFIDFPLYLCTLPCDVKSVSIAQFDCSRQGQPKHEEYIRFKYRIPKYQFCWQKEGESYFFPFDLKVDPAIGNNLCKMWI